MNKATIRSIGVCGAGTMGSGIAQVCAQAGFQTLLFDLNAEIINQARRNITQQWQRMVDKGKMTGDQQDAAINNLRFTSDISSCIADLFIEAIVEKPAAKIGLFNQLDAINQPDCIFASNTSSLSISQLAAQIKNPARVLGMHFFNPAPVMKLVEIVKGENTSEEVIATIMELTRQLGKTPVLCKDAPGFIVNRVARPYYIESLRLAEEGLSDFAQMDRLLTARGFKMGPFELMDLIGNDVNYAVSCSVYDQLGQPERLKPSYIQEEKVKEGKLGRKSGDGYFRYENGK